MKRRRAKKKKKKAYGKRLFKVTNLYKLKVLITNNALLKMSFFL